MHNSKYVSTWSYSFLTKKDARWQVLFIEPVDQLEFSVQVTGNICYSANQESRESLGFTKEILMCGIKHFKGEESILQNDFLVT